MHLHRICALMLATAAPMVAAERPTLDQVLARLTDYLTTYERTLVAVVAEEKYEQSLTIAAAKKGAPPITEHRALTSDFALARMQEDTAWMGFRDTFSVNGQPVRDREARLERLLSAGSRDGFAQAQAMSRENSRYNVGEDLVTRTINVPTMVLGLIRNRSRFTFRKNGEETLDGRLTWMVAYKERERPTLIRTPNGRNQPVSGLVWIVPETGEILKTSLTAAADRMNARTLIIVEYRPDIRLGTLVPVHMIESYRTSNASISADATYSNFRRFETSARIIR
jgi:hypothetical protein